jgi:hypothetical protein
MLFGLCFRFFVWGKKQKTKKKVFWCNIKVKTLSNILWVFCILNYFFNVFILKKKKTKERIIKKNIRYIYVHNNDTNFLFFFYKIIFNFIDQSDGSGEYVGL